MTGQWLRRMGIALVALLGISAFAALMLTRTQPGRRPRPAE